MLAAESYNLLFGRLRAIFEDDKGCDFFAVKLIGHTDSRGCGDSLMLEKNFVYLARVDVLAAADNHVGLAINDIEETIRVSVSNIVCVKPTIAKSVCGCFTVLVI